MQISRKLLDRYAGVAIGRQWAHLALNFINACSMFQHEVVEDVGRARHGRAMKYVMVKLSVGHGSACLSHETLHATYSVLNI